MTTQTRSERAPLRIPWWLCCILLSGIALTYLLSGWLATSAWAAYPAATPRWWPGFGAPFSGSRGHIAAAS